MINELLKNHVFETFLFERDTNTPYDLDVLDIDVICHVMM